MRGYRNFRICILLRGGYLRDFFKTISHVMYQSKGKLDVLCWYCLISKGSSESCTRYTVLTLYVALSKVLNCLKDTYKFWSI